jgi:fatty acid desaturase
LRKTLKSSIEITIKSISIKLLEINCKKSIITPITLITLIMSIFLIMEIISMFLIILIILITTMLTSNKYLHHGSSQVREKV